MHMELKVFFSLLMGVAIFGMHFVGMLAATFTFVETDRPFANAIEPSLQQVSSAHQGCIYLLKKISENCKTEILLLKITFLFECIVKCNLFLWCKAEFFTSLRQSSVSHDPSEIILICLFAAQEIFLININVENNCAASYFVETVIHFIFQDPLMNRKFKGTGLGWFVA